MNKKIWLFICIFMIISFTACSNTNSVAVKKPIYPKNISFDDYDGRRELRENNPIDDSFVKSVNNFSYRTASKILNIQTENICYSPLSLYMALSLAGVGANGTTQDEILSALGVSGKGVDYLSEQNGNLFRLLYSDNKIGKLRIANSLWLHEKTKFKDEYIDNAVENFYASLYSVDFADANTAEFMSKWISENTNGILKPQINLDKEQIMSIINTIYFKGEWVNRFDKNNTKPDVFYLTDGSEVECDFMNSTYEVHGYNKGEGFTSSSLSLKNSGSMIFILPDEDVSIDELLSTPEKVASLFDNSNRESGKVVFQIPKFSFGNDIELKETLESIGVKSALDENADFTGITDDIAYISDVKQQAHIAVDENGVEAAAFTQIDYAGSAPPNEKIAEMILDRPFIFAITANQGSILFMGVVNNPNEM